MSRSFFLIWIFLCFVVLSGSGCSLNVVNGASGNRGRLVFDRNLVNNPSVIRPSQRTEIGNTSHKSEGVVTWIKFEITVGSWIDFLSDALIFSWEYDLNVSRRLGLGPTTRSRTNGVPIEYSGSEILGVGDHEPWSTAHSQGRRLPVISKIQLKRDIRFSDLHVERIAVYSDPGPCLGLHGLPCNLVSVLSGAQLPMNHECIDRQSNECEKRDYSPSTGDTVEPLGGIELLLSIIFFFGITFFVIGLRLNFYGIEHTRFALQMTGWLIMVLGGILALGPIVLLCAKSVLHILDDLDGTNTVPQEYMLTSPIYWGTVSGIGRADMPNVLSTDRQVAVIGAFAESSGIRQIERMSGVHQDTIMRLGARVGQGCTGLLGRKMRNLSCQQLQFDEIRGSGKKERHCTVDDAPEIASRAYHFATFGCTGCNHLGV